MVDKCRAKFKELNQAQMAERDMLRARVRATALNDVSVPREPLRQDLTPLIKRKSKMSFL